MGKKILVIEDEEVIAEVLRDNLRVMGHEVIIANSGIEGLRKAESMHPDIITLDVMMPGLNGIQVLKGLKNNEVTKDIPVIIVSVEGEFNKVEGLKLGALAFLRKPLNFGQLNQRIKSLTERKTVLVVEDSPTVLSLIETRLNSMGYKVICVLNGEDALLKARELKPDIILMDVVLPKEDGFEITKKLKAEAEVAEIPVIAFSGQFSEGIDEKKVIGADKFLGKKFSAEDLANEVNNFLKQSEQDNMSGKKVLIVDDRDDDRIILRNALETQSYMVFEASNGMDALDKIKKEKFDVCFVDFRMPGMNGLETIDKIKEINPEIGVVLISGYILEEAQKAEIKKRKDIPFISKPYDVNSLVNVLEKLNKEREITSGAS